MKKYKFELYHTDTCLPDYFSGDSRPWVTYPIYNHPTLQEIKDYLKNEVNNGAIGGSMYTWKEMGSEAMYDAIHAAIDNLTPNEDLPEDYKFFQNVELLEEDDNGYDVCQAFFVFVPVDCEE